MPERKFIVTPKEENSVTFTVRVAKDINDAFGKLARDSNRSRNELINLALAYALENLEFVDDEK